MECQRLEQIRHYAALVESALRNLPPAGSFRPESEGGLRVQIERGLLFPQCQRWIGRPGGALPAHPAAMRFVDPLAERLIELAPEGGRLADVVDRLGHRRPAYRGLLVYAWLQATRILSRSPEPDDVQRAARWRPALLAWCRWLEADVRAWSWTIAGASAADGPKVVAAAWAALSLSAAAQVLSHDDWTFAARDFFSKLATSQQRSGAFLLARPADNLETHWYHELVLLHALASSMAHAAQSGEQSGGGAIAAAVDAAAEYHQAETEPDHATGQPWALFAFASNPRTRPLADQVLHGAMVHAAQAAGESAGQTSADGVSFILLADALYCLNVCQVKPHPNPPTL